MIMIEVCLETNVSRKEADFYRFSIKWLLLKTSQINIKYL